MRAALKDARLSYGLRWKRRRLLLRIWRKRKQITPVKDRTAQIKPDAILAFVTIRNEMLRLPHFLDYYRKLGVSHFLIVDNASMDGTAEFLADQPDVSLWTTSHSYKLSRFGMDWLGWLQWQYGQDHWCLTVDADELLVYSQCDSRDLRALTTMTAQTIAKRLEPVRGETAEFRSDRFLAAVDWQSENLFRLAYIVRAVSPGSFHHPAASVEDMYRPQMRARTDAGQVTITQ